MALTNEDEELKAQNTNAGNSTALGNEATIESKTNTNASKTEEQKDLEAEDKKAQKQKPSIDGQHPMEEEEEVSVEEAYLNGDLDNLDKKEQKEVDKFQKDMSNDEKRASALDKIKWRIGDNVTVQTDYGSNADRDHDHYIENWEENLENRDREALKKTILDYDKMNSQQQEEALKTAFGKYSGAGKDDTMNIWDVLGAKISAPFDRANQWWNGKSYVGDLDGNPNTTNYGVEVKGKGKNGELTNSQKRQIARREKALAASIPGFIDMTPEQQQQALSEAYAKYNTNGDDKLSAWELTKLQVGNKINEKLYGGAGVEDGDEFTTGWGGNADRNGDGKVTGFEKWLNSNNEKALARTIPNFDNMSLEEKRDALSDAFDTYDLDKNGSINLLEHGLIKLSKANKWDKLIHSDDKGWWGDFKRGLGKAGAALNTFTSFNPFKMLTDSIKYGAQINKSERDKIAAMSPEERDKYLAEKEKRLADQEEKEGSIIHDIADFKPPQIGSPQNNNFATNIENDRKQRLGIGGGWDMRAEKNKMGKLEPEVVMATVSDARLKDYIMRTVMDDSVFSNLAKLVMLDKLTENKVIQTPNGNIYQH